MSVGAFLVNVGWLPVRPHDFIRGFAEIGIIVIMFALGFEEQVDHFVASIRRSWGIALFGAVGPFVAAYAVAEAIWGDYHISLMCGLAMTATAVSLTMVILKGEGLAGSPAATRIMTSAILDDIASLALIAVMIPIATGAALPSAVELLAIVGKVLLFFLIVSAVGLWIFPPRRGGWLARVPLVRHITAARMLAFEGGQYATLIVLLLAVGVGLLAHAFGFHPAVGAYMAGLILREEYFGEASENTGYRYTKQIVDNVAFSWIGPVFFVQLGTQIVIDWHLVVDLVPETVAMLTAVFFAQIATAALAARYTSGLDRRDSLLVGVGMLGRAELAFVVLDIAYVQNPVLNEAAFYTLMFTAFWLNVSVPLLVRWWRKANETVVEEPEVLPPRS